MKKARIFFIIVSFFIGLSLSAQPPETIYQGNEIARGYLPVIPPESMGPYPIGFNFVFFGNTYSNFYVGAEGLVMFNAPEDEYSNSVIIPSPGSPNNFIAPFWDNLSVLDGGNVMYKTIGSDPNKKCIIQFRNMGFDPIPSAFGTFTVILYQNGEIQTQYRLILDPYSPKSHGLNATIGLENIDGTAGSLYRFHDGSAVTKEQAIKFTPSGSTYTIDDNATYDGVFLTTNITLPDPGIVSKISPSPDAVIGANHTFQWSPATNASSYILFIDSSPDLSTATTYDAGSNLSYNVTGLSLGQTYYWAVFSQNSTAVTWCEVGRFETSSTPPLTAVSRELWISQNEEKTITLQYTGGDASAKTAVITSLPAEGQLWQVVGGIKSIQITSVPAVLTDPDFKVIYIANGTTGNGVGTFYFRFTDDTGDSPTAHFKINVNAPGIPNLLNTARSSAIELQFDRKMNDPAGKENQFTVNIDGTPATINSATLKNNDPYSIILLLNPVLTGSETVTVSYTKGTVTATTGGLLESFTDQPVTLIAQTITFTTNLDKKYGNPPFTLSSTSGSGLTTFTYSSSNLSVASITGATLTIGNVGTSEITALQAGNATYAPARNVRTLTVSKGDQTITFGALPSKTYGMPDFSLTATSGSGLTVSYASNNSAVATVFGSTVHIVGAGSATITASQAGNSLWNPATPVDQTLTVQKADQAITFEALPVKAYNDADFSLSATSASGLPVTYTSSNTDIATIAGNLVSIAGVGTTEITASQPGNSNWNAALPVNQTLTVQKADQSIAFDAVTSKTFGDTDFALVATSESGLPVTYASSNSDVVSITGNMVHIVAAGSAIITASQAGNDNWNAATSVDQTLTVQKAGQSITFDALGAKTFGDAGFSLIASSASGLPITFVSGNTAVATISGNTVHIVGAGTSVITASQEGNSNWNAATPVDQTLTVQKAGQTITFDVLSSKTYGDLDFALSATSASGLPVTYASGNTAVATISGNTVHIVGAGTSVITASQSGNTNWNAATPVDQTLTVQKAGQTITFDVLSSKTYGDSDFDLSATSASGLPVTYASSNTAVATISGNTVHIVGAGTSVITASQPGNTNWNAATPADQTLTVQKADQTITFDPLTPKQVTDPDFLPGATASSGLVITFSSDNPSVATITGGMIHLVGEGSAMITAYQNGNGNYNAATAVNRDLVVTFPTGIEDPLATSKNFMIYHSQDKIYIKALQSYWDGRTGAVRIFNLNGTPVRDFRNVIFSTNSALEIPAPEFKGLYLIEIRSGLKRFTGKFVK